MKGFFDFVFNKWFRNIFAVMAFFYCGWKLDKGNLTPQAQTRFEDFIAVIISYYFVASSSAAKKDETIANLAGQQQPQVPVTGDNPQINVNTNDKNPTEPPI